MTVYAYSMLPKWSATRREFEALAPVAWKRAGIPADIVELELKERAIIAAGKTLKQELKSERDSDKRRYLENKLKHRASELVQVRAMIAAYRLRYQQGIDAGLGGAP